MEAFQIHEDIENVHSKIHAKKFLLDCDSKKIVKKKFGENNGTYIQPLQNNGFKNAQIGRVFSNNEICAKEQRKKQKIVVSYEKEAKQESQIVEVENLFLKINDKENTESEKLKKSKIYCSMDILQKEYGADIYKYLRQLEEAYPRPKSVYMVKQHDLNWGSRSILIDWLISISDEYELSHESLHLSINYIDLFLGCVSVIRNKFQLVGAAAMRLATKMEEYQPLDAKEWSYLTGDTFTPRQIMKMEQIILKVLGFNMKIPTVCDFIQHLACECGMDEKTVHLALYISELVLLEGDDYLNHFPSKLAAACIALARYILSKPNPWPAKLKKISGYSLKELSPVVQRQHKTLEDSPMKDQKAVIAKYKSSKFSQVALMKPRKLSMEYLESANQNSGLNNIHT